MQGDPETGVIYVATGDDYVELARASALSLKATNPGIAADLFTDATDRPGLEVFDRVHRVPRIHVRAKLDCMPLSRFARTLFLDCDTLVVGPLGDLFDIATRFDIAMAHDVRRSSDLVQEGLQARTPYAFPQLNSGVVLYRRSAATAAFFADWGRRFHDTGVNRDQIVLKDLLWESDLRFYVLPPEFNLRRVTMLDAWEPLDARPTIIHSHRLMDHMRALGTMRVRTLDHLLTLEREALLQEWADAGVSTEGRAQLSALLPVLQGRGGDGAAAAVAPARAAAVDQVARPGRGRGRGDASPETA